MIVPSAAGNGTDMYFDDGRATKFLYIPVPFNVLSYPVRMHVGAYGFSSFSLSARSNSQLTVAVGNLAEYPPTYPVSDAELRGICRYLILAAVYPAEFVNEIAATEWFGVSMFMESVGGNT